ECSELLEIYSDGNKIDAILTNLIKNAIKFTNRGFIKIKCSHKKEEITISVEDSGIGISENQKHRLFERFIQAENFTPSEGSGLGLAITKAYVEMLGGTITLESIENKGSKFTIVLPLD
ncbi:MAG TPA: ATP-binding protein, partial [Flavobacterium sp.]|nr:ATP-binding protein [Flavobacterium sp.]